jgi:tRNA(Ile)-lysidine synthase
VSDLLKCADQNISTHRLLRDGAPLLVAVSGGADSMVLLAVLHALAGKHSWKLTVAHFNHRLRGRSSDADERSVRRMAKALGLKIAVQSADVKRWASDRKVSVEMAARKLRHDFLVAAARRMGISTIALGHHADDQLELFFLRLLRGSGSDGLSGMKWRSHSPADPEITLVRPLLDQEKSALLKHARERRIVFREDASNASVEFQRNRVRHELLPLLKRKYQPALRRVIERVADISAQNADFVDAAAECWLKGKGKEPFETLHVAVQRRCLQRQLQTLGIPVDYELIEMLRAGRGRAFSAGPDLFVLCEEGRIALRGNLPGNGAGQGRAEVQLGAGEGKARFERLEIHWRFSSRKASLLLRSLPSREIFDADAVGPAVVLRHWQPGDRFRPIGMPGAVKLQDLFTNLKIPRTERHELVVATTEGGEVFWVERLRIGERFKVSPKTIRRLLWHWNRR